MTREELIAALEKASKPSRELDGYIYMLTLPASRRKPVSWEVTPEGMIWAWTRNPPHAPGTGGWWATPPEYTASIDAALTLVPEGWNASIFTGCGIAEVEECMSLDDDRKCRIEQGEARTPAIALCIAALKAQEATDD